MTTAITVFGVFAAIFLIVAYCTQSLQTIKTRDTSGINPYMFGIVWMASLFFIIFAALLAASSTQTGNAYVTFFFSTPFPTLVSNVIVGFFCTIVFWIKIQNMLGAKKHNLSEKDYYAKHVLPKLKRQRAS